MMTPSTIDMTDLEDAIDEKLDAQDAEACGASTGEIHDTEDVEQQDGDEQEQQEITDSESTSDPETPPAEPESLSAWEHDLLTRIRKQEQRVAMAENEVDWRKEALKEAKASFEGEVSLLRKLICQRDEKLPLFDLQSKQVEAASVPAPQKALPDAATDAESDPATASDSTADESWRDVEISALNIADSLATKLYESSIETIGDLTDWQSSGKQLTDIKGVGAAKADKIADALEEFWRANPQHTR